MAMRREQFKSRMLAGERLAGTFIRMPDISLLEVIAQTDLDFVVLDAEHGPFGRAERDRCLAMAMALDLPALVRVPGQDEILSALDDGALGVVVPHVDSAEKAQAVAKAAHFGKGGRGYAGSTRWAGMTTRPMDQVLDQDAGTIVIAQIEEPEGVDAVDAIAATPGIDGLFAGPADLSVSYGERKVGSDRLTAALEAIGQATRRHGKAYVSWIPDAGLAAEWAKHGITTFVVGSDQSWIRSGAKATAATIRQPD
ncbi:HpcH/HpaI aldolase family protein [Alexandriicola marinus]|uniref:HpcH/HpaI aldolase family protein n=1 Tax=Alexandriicola marinus TaxID=2081710 RepID=UPI001EED6C15|nr:aldolase/citrate lyase family protein [Alexandriicola marinus]